MDDFPLRIQNTIITKNYVILNNLLQTSKTSSGHPQ